MVSSLWNLWNNLRLRACRQLLVQVVALPVQFLVRTYCSSVGTSLLRGRSCCSEMNRALAGQHPSWTRVVPILDPSGGSRLFQTCQRTQFESTAHIGALQKNLVDFCSPVLYFRGSSPASGAIRFPASVFNELSPFDATKVLLSSVSAICNALIINVLYVY